MLDSSTKRRIDTARDILVGKVPDPKSQVEQITIALIYKFMDDIDAESEELGGTRTFFAGAFARYGWAKLVRAGLGGHETLNLYAEAITTMPENPGIPPLFRDIFKNAFLPYRDPETLRAFLKVIDEFTYDHSERLGDAFEYLLSVLGAQGDAGQFRTPRHVIDFIVAVLDPQKDESVLDPACGTAGFLVSSYKHIRAANTDADGNSTLTPDDRGRLAANFRGYDISPDMVRLSLVNLYLHGFAAPHVFEYDTLTSEDRWHERADVILANPPFMSPKGGIRPHSRFSVKSKRSEVLFVDYMAEHLTPAGRAGIIVPEGIIFQSQKAHKQLRKLLVEDFLVAVVSLPTGVFQPYSGVKTSILLLDKALAKRTDRIGFFKVEHDGYDLGAQRRPIERNDLPRAQAEIGEYLRRVRAREAVAEFAPTLGQVVEKERVAADGDYNLSGERYREGISNRTQWLTASLTDIATIESGSRQKGGAVCEGVPSIGGEQIDKNGSIRFDKMKFVSQEHFDRMSRGVLKRGDVLLVKDGATTGKSGYFSYDIDAAVNEHVFIIRANQEVLPYYLYSVISSQNFQNLLRRYIKGIIGGISREIGNIEIPLPPLELQREIVAEVKGYRKIIDGARAVVDNYQPQIPSKPDWPVVELGKVIQGKPKNGYSGRPVSYTTHIKVLSLSATTSGRLDISQHKYLDEDIPFDSPCRCRHGDIYLQRGNTKELVGTAARFDSNERDYVYPDLMVRVQADETQIGSKFLLYILQSSPVREYMKRNAVGAAGNMPKINQQIVNGIPIPLPPIATQQEIVKEIEAEQTIVDNNSELIRRFERKIQTAVARIWGDEKMSE